MKWLVKICLLFLLPVYALAQNQEIESLKQQLTQTTQDSARVTIMIQLIWDYRYTNADSALFYGNKAADLARQINFPKGEIGALAFSGITLQAMGDLPKSLETGFEAIRIAEKSHFTYEKGAALSLIGNVYFDIKDYTKAMSYFREMLKNVEAKKDIEKEFGYGTKDKGVGHAFATLDIGRVYLESNHLDSALYYLRQSEQDFILTGMGIQPLLYTTFGDTYYKLGNQQLALDYYRKALQIAHNNNDHFGSSISNTRIAQFYKKLNKTDSSIYYAKQGLAEAQLGTQKSAVLEASSLLSNLYENSDSKEAFRYYKLAAATKDSLFGAGNMQAIRTMIAQEESRQKDIETTRINYQTQLKQFALLVGLGIMFLIGFFLYRNNRQKQKANTQLQNTLTELKTAQTELEAKNREAVRRASLDRVRAETASMRTTADLDKIIPLIWNELTTLGISFIRCGVFIIDTAQEQIHIMLSTPTGKSIAAFYLPFDNAQGSFTEIVAHWRKHTMYKDHWDQAAFVDFTANLLKQGTITSSEQYATDHPPMQLDLQFLPFSQGMLYIGSETPLNESELEVVQSLADAFSSAYARYEDFSKLEASKQQVDKTLIELKQTQAQLVQKEKLASLGELTAGIAHEIQNPLNFVNNFADFSIGIAKELNEELDKPKIDKGYIEELLKDLTSNQEKISFHGKRASSIVKGMLGHSRASTGKKEMTDINELVDESFRLSYHGLRAKDKSFNATMVTHYDPENPKMEIVSQDVGRVILNLINNAFYAVTEKKKLLSVNNLNAEEAKNLVGFQNLVGFKNLRGLEAKYEPTVTVSTQKIDEGIEIRVKDNGTGMPESVKEKVFQPFFTTKPTGQGTGLGLSLSYEIITKGHDGKIEINTKDGEFTEFIILLPYLYKK